MMPSHSNKNQSSGSLGGGGGFVGLEVCISWPFLAGCLQMAGLVAIARETCNRCL